MLKLINQDEALKFWESIEDPIVQGLIQSAHTEMFLGKKPCQGEFDLLFFYKVLEAFLRDRERLARTLVGEGAEHSWVAD